MLTEFQRTRVWENILAAETRALYFGDLACRYSRRKQWITGVSFFLASGAAATIIGKAPSWVPAILAVIVAASTAYSMAVNLDRRALTMANLHSSWTQIRTEYECLWNHAYDEDAEEQFERILALEKDPSELAASDAPNNQKLLSKWQQRVFSLYHVAQLNG